MIAAAYDPWDEKNFHDEDDRFFTLLPITSETNAECWRMANTRVNDLLHGPWPDTIPSALSCVNPNVVITAFYREAEDFAGKHVENYAGVGMGYPYIIRLVEFDGLETDAEFIIVGPIANAYKTNLLGQIEEEVAHAFSHTEGNFSYEKITLKMRAHEIATLYLDIIPGRKETRDLDAKREIWATVHRTEQT
jgi:alpha-mannosidase